jgi:hypothetical protein
VILRLFAVPPGAIGELAGATVANGLARCFKVFGSAGVLPGAGEKSGTKQVGVVNGILFVSDVTEAIAGAGLLARELENPGADAAGGIEEAAFIRPLECLQVGLADESAPNNRRLMGRHTAATCGEVEVVSPAVTIRSFDAVSIEPVEALDGFAFVRIVSGGGVPHEVSPSHEARTLRGIERFDADERPQVDRAFPYRLLQNPLGENIAEGERAQPGGEAVSRVIPL